VITLQLALTTVSLPTVQMERAAPVFAPLRLRNWRTTYLHLSRHCTHLLDCALVPQNFKHSQPFLALDCAHASPPDIGGLGASVSNIARAMPVNNLIAIRIDTSLAQPPFIFAVDANQGKTPARRSVLQSLEMVNVIPVNARRCRAPDS
jgi:hypothetical protein